MYKLAVKNLSKRFGHREVLSNINLELKTGDSLAIVGPNGSGKSTFMLCLLAQYRPTKGTVSYFSNGQAMVQDQIQAACAFVSPYLQLYGQLTAEENLQFFSTMRGMTTTGKQINSLLSRVGLEGRGFDPVATYSSGMQQRLKYALAMLSEPTFLFLDEPTSNLDEKGKQVVFDIIDEYRTRSVIVLATNEQKEYGLAQSQCRLGE